MDERAIGNRAFYRKASRVLRIYSTKGVDDEEAVVDLLADLMHYCERFGIDFTAQLALAQAHFKYETEERLSV